MIGYSMANQELERIKDFKGFKKYIYPGEGHIFGILISIY